MAQRVSVSSLVDPVGGAAVRGKRRAIKSARWLTVLRFTYAKPTVRFP